MIKGAIFDFDGTLVDYDFTVKLCTISHLRTE